MLVAFKTQLQEWKDSLPRGKDPVMLDKHWKAFATQEIAVDDRTRALLASLTCAQWRPRRVCADPARARSYDLPGDTLPPGLTDVHVHLNGDPTLCGWCALEFTDSFWQALGVANANAMLETGRAAFQQSLAELQKGPCRNNDRAWRGKNFGAPGKNHRRRC